MLLSDPGMETGGLHSKEIIDYRHFLGIATKGCCYNGSQKERQTPTACNWKGAVFVICYCVMNDSKTISLSWNCLFICVLGIWAGSVGSSTSTSLTGCNQGVSQDCGHLKAQQGKDPIVCVRSESLGSAHRQGVRNIQECEYQEAGITGSYFTSLPTKRTEVSQVPKISFPYYYDILIMAPSETYKPTKWNGSTLDLLLQHGDWQEI